MDKDMNEIKDNEISLYGKTQKDFKIQQLIKEM